MRYIYLILFTVCSLSVFSNKVAVVFRYDDFQLLDDSTNQKIVNTFTKYQVPLVLAVIPCDANENFVFNMRDNFLSEIKKAEKKGLIEIALHGLNHQKMTIYGEMKGLSLKEQLRRISKGRMFLQRVLDCKVSTFIPPWNAHDENTVKALHQNDIHIVSSSVYDVYGEKANYPLTTDSFHGLEKTIEDNRSLGGIIVVMIHPYDFKNNTTFNDLDQLLQNLKENTKVSLHTFKSLDQSDFHISNFQMRNFFHENLIEKNMHLKGVYLPDKIIVVIKFLNAVIYLILFYVLFYFSGLFILRKKRGYNLIEYFILFVPGIFVILSTWYYLFGPAKLLLIWSVLALLFPLVFLFFRKLFVKK